MKISHFLPLRWRLRLGHIRTTIINSLVNILSTLDSGTTHVALPSRKVFNMDGLATIHQTPFSNDRTFMSSLSVGIAVAEGDFGNWWRIYIATWCAKNAVNKKGDFVELGTGRGVTMATILTDLKWNRLDKSCYLVDTFLPHKVNRESGDQVPLSGTNDLYAQNVDQIKEKFAQWQRVHFIQGRAPQVLLDFSIGDIAFLHIDLNSPKAEIASLEVLWDSVVSGGQVLFDDYAYMGCEDLRELVDSFASRRKLSILGLPTGQGLIVKP